MGDYRAEAERFLTEETQFHLGFLTTEQSHPRTRGLAETLQRDCAAGVRMLQAVDRDVAVLARQVLHGDRLAQLVAALSETFLAGGRVCFSGCGATGRLSILLEAMWRRFWRDLADRQPSLLPLAAQMADQVISLMTGGDYALIRSVEGFEDYASFGRQQVIEAGLGAGDTLVAISEGGETSSVIGSLLEAAARGVRTFFVFNNPADVLSRHIARSREAIQCPGVTVLDLTTGPMAVAGSTRMQATTAELLVLGAGLEQALVSVLPEVLPGEALRGLPSCWLEPADRVAQFDELLGDLANPPAVAAMAAWVDMEHDLYTTGGRVTYFAGDCLLDIFTDTTERAPTFTLPPFRKCDDQVSPPPWAMVKDPVRPTGAAWRHMLGRPPRCLDWDSARYQALGAAASICAAPPRLSSGELVKFLIGAEPDPSRTEVQPNAALAVLVGRELDGSAARAWQEAFRRAAAPFMRQLTAVIGNAPPADTGWGETLHVPCRLPSTPLTLWERLAAKLVLNVVSTATAGKLGRLVSNWMVHVETSNKKLIDRGTRLVAELCGLDYATACYELHRTMAELRASAVPGRPRVSPVAETVRRLSRQ